MKKVLFFGTVGQFRLCGILGKKLFLVGPAARGNNFIRPAIFYPPAEYFMRNRKKLAATGIVYPQFRLNFRARF